MLKEASYYEILPAGRVHCRLCPHECIIADGKRGVCGVRANRGGRLYSEIYGEITSVALDPIEKKPLYRYHPGEFILSIATKGCNFHCGFCQNWQISQGIDAPAQSATPEEIVEKTKSMHSFGIAYTYNEPFIWYEFVRDTAILAKENGLENVLVTNGYVNEKPLIELLPYINAMNIDLKSIEPEFYRKICRGELEPVLRTIELSRKSCHVELTCLIIPTLNDDEKSIEKLVTWVSEHAGSDTPLHISRYFPCYQFKIPPTPASTLKTAERIARRKLKYVYLGNV